MVPQNERVDVNIKPQSRRRGIASKLADELNNPCMKESSMSIQCLDENDYDKEKCFLEFQNYKGCMEFWRRVQWDRKSKQIKPYLPLPEERETMRKEYFDKHN